MDICRFDSFDLDADQQITENELSILIDITGLVDLDELFEQLDVNKGKHLYVLCLIVYKEFLKVYNRAVNRL